MSVIFYDSKSLKRIDDKSTTDVEEKVISRQIVKDIKSTLSDIDPIQRALIISKVKRMFNTLTSYVKAKPDVQEQELFYVMKRTMPELTAMFDSLDALRPLVDSDVSSQISKDYVLNFVNKSVIDLDQDPEYLKNLIKNVTEEDISSKIGNIMEFNS